MKKTLLLLFIVHCQLSIVNCFSQTNVSGFINSNTTWTVAGSPYIVVGNALLSHGYTLTIDPGVVVKFNTNTALQIDGELHAVGTPANRITFTSNQAIPHPGDWGDIQFSDTCVDAVFDAAGNYLSGTVMKYCDVMYGGGLTSAATQVEDCSVYFSNCRFNYNKLSGLTCLGFAKLDSCSARYNKGGGMGFSMNAPSYCPYVFEYDTLEYNEAGGVAFSMDGGQGCTGYTLIFRNNYFRGNDTSSALNVGYTNHHKLLVSENQFLNNSPQYNSCALCISGSDSGATVECNRFIDNTFTDRALVEMSSYHNDTLRNNLFDGNICNAWPWNRPLVKFQKLNYSDALISNNRFDNNIASAGTVLYLQGFSNAAEITTYYINNNEFKSNEEKSDIYLYIPSADFSLQFASISGNNFLDTLTQYVIDNHSAFGGPNIDADSNYWNSSNTQHVDSVIDDYFDYAGYSVVFYSPILSSPALVDTTCPPSITTAINEVEKQTEGFTIYPNPAHNSFTISLNKWMVDAGQLTMYDIAGRCVYQKKIEHCQLSTVNCQLNSGVYFVKVMSGEKSETKKLIIE